MNTRVVKVDCERRRRNYIPSEQLSAKVRSKRHQLNKFTLRTFQKRNLDEANQLMNTSKRDLGTNGNESTGIPN